MMKVFLDLVDSASFSEAARKNQVSQSAISQRIRAIESTLKVNLIEKTQKSLKLTREGLIFYKYAQQILSHYATMLSDIENPSKNDPDELMIATSDWIGVYILPQFIHEYFQRFQKFNIDIHYADSMQARQGLRSDLFLFEKPLSSRDFTSSPFLKEEFIPIGSRKTFPQPETLALQKIKTFPLVGFHSQHSLRNVFEKALENYALSPHYTVELGQIELVKQAVLSHNGIAFLPRSTVFPDISSSDGSRFQKISLTECTLPFSLYVSYPKERTPSQSAQQFLNILNEYRSENEPIALFTRG
ncbi:MAG: LysR family transcriptional regulator [Verrucomicrobiota bacterium]|nr:MAG: LysR family transcriptional regulator [Verrucomicrobiota bacterium]